MPVIGMNSARKASSATHTVAEDLASNEENEYEADMCYRHPVRIFLYHGVYILCPKNLFPQEREFSKRAC